MMKKMFVALLGVIGITVAVNAATVNDIKLMKHSYVCVFDNYTGDGTVRRVKGSLFGGNYFLDVTGGSVSTGKFSINIAEPATYPTCYGGAEADTSRLMTKYAKYGSHLNSLRLKNSQDVIALKPTAGSVIYVFGSGNNRPGSSARVPKFATDVRLENPLNEAPTEDYPASGKYCYRFIVPDDFVEGEPLYIGSYNGDAFFSFIIVEANEPAGTPSVCVGNTAYDEVDKLYYQEVDCTPQNYILEGVDYGETEVYYTTDGSQPTSASNLYTGPIKCYKDMTVKFQAYWNGVSLKDADNEALVEFKFYAPTLVVDDACATITTEYMNATNYCSLDGGRAVAGDRYMATTSGNLIAYTEIKNGEHVTWTSDSVSSPIYVLDPIKEKKLLTIIANGTEFDEEATAANTKLDEYDNPLPIYKALNPKVLYNGMEKDFCFYLVPDATFSVIKDDTAQIGGQEVYLQMDKPNLTFMVADGDSVCVRVTVSRNSHRNEYDLQTYVNVNGTYYGHEDILTEGNVIEFGLGGGIHTFQKWSGSGNIHVASIEIIPIVNGSIEDVPVTTNTFSLSDTSVFAGSTFSLPVSMTNESDITAFQCDVYLSDGLRLNLNDEGEYDVALSSTRKTSSHSLAASVQPDGAIRIAAYSSANKLFKGNEGELFTLNLTALEGYTGRQRVAIRNIRLSTPDQKEYLLPNVVSTVTVSSYTPADVNGDGEVTIVDVVSVVNALMGTITGNFIFEAADMDQNGEITIVDVVAVVNTLMGKDVQALGARSLLRCGIHVADAAVSAGGTATLYVKLDNAQAYTAMQMDVNLPEGLTVEGVELVGCPSHVVVCNEAGRIAAYSLNNSRFNPGESLMAITVKMDNSFTGNALVGFTNVRVVSTNVQETLLSDVLANIAGGGATGIDGVQIAEPVQTLYYSVTGAVSETPHQGLNIIKRICEDGRVEVSKEVCE